LHALLVAAFYDGSDLKALDISLSRLRAELHSLIDEPVKSSLKREELKDGKDHECDVITMDIMHLFRHDYNWWQK
jgi:hypothetical protein